MNEFVYICLNNNKLHVWISATIRFVNKDFTRGGIKAESWTIGKMKRHKMD